MNKQGKPLISFDVKEGKYAVGDVLKALNFLVAFNKEKNLATKAIYGDGELQVEVYNDKGFTGSITLTAPDPDYEIDLGMSMKIDGGIATVTQHQSVLHNIYFETYNLITQPDGTSFKKVTAKVWVFGVTASAPSETLNQSTDGINENSVDYPLNIKGVTLKNITGAEDFTDVNGNKFKVYTYKKLPGQPGYDNFGDAVPVPKMVEAQGASVPVEPDGQESGGQGED